MAAKPLEKTVSIVQDLSEIEDGEFKTFDISEYAAIRLLLHNARHGIGKVTRPLWGRRYVLRMIKPMYMVFVGVQGDD